MPNKNNQTITAEQIILEEQTDKELAKKEISTQTQLQASDILKTKQLIPHNFVRLETKGKNYVCSTQGWPKEPVCERYGFSANGKWVQLDITHELMKKLELELGKEITYPLYISPMILARKPDEFGGITLKKEERIFLLKPLTSERGTQTELNNEEISKLGKKIEDLEIIVASQKESYEKLEKEKNEWKQKMEQVESQIHSRSWKGFYDWLRRNIFDVVVEEWNVVATIKENKKKDYPLLNSYIEKGKQRGVAGYLLHISNYWGTYHKNFLTEYDDGKEFMDFLIPSDNESYNYVYNILVKGSEEEKELAKEFNKLLQDYRKNPTEGMVRWRSWVSFVDWLEDNFIDKAKWGEANKLRIKEPSISHQQWIFKDIWREDKKKCFTLKDSIGEINSLIYWLLFRNAKGLEEKPSSWVIRDFFSNWILLPYEENKMLKELFLNTMDLSNWEILFLEWKLATPLQNY